MDNLFVLLLLASLVLLGIGLISPKTSLFWDKKERTRKKSALIYGGLTILFFILFGATNDGKKERSNETTKTTSSPTPTDAPISKTETEQASSINEQENTTDYKKIDDQVEIGNFSYLVNKASFAKTIGNEFMKKTADGVFLVVNVTLEIMTMKSIRWTIPSLN